MCSAGLQCQANGCLHPVPRSWAKSPSKQCHRRFCHGSCGCECSYVSLQFHPRKSKGQDLLKQDLLGQHHWVVFFTGFKKATREQLPLQISSELGRAHNVLNKSTCYVMLLQKFCMTHDTSTLYMREPFAWSVQDLDNASANSLKAAEHGEMCWSPLLIHYNVWESHWKSFTACRFHILLSGVTPTMYICLCQPILLEPGLR